MEITSKSEREVPRKNASFPGQAVRLSQLTYGKVDDLITAIPGEWTFDEQVAKGFDDHVRKSIPLYDEIQRMIVEISEWFVRDHATICDLGSSTGETIRLLQQKHGRKKHVHYIGVEVSDAMIQIAESKCLPECTRFINEDLRHIAAIPRSDLVTSLLTLHFLPRKHRLPILSKVHDSLSAGGALIVVEKIRAEGTYLEDMWLELYWDFKRRQGLSDEMILQKARSLRGVLFPLTLSENVELFRHVGFSNIEVFVKWYNFAGIIAFKSERDHSEFDVSTKKRAQSRNLP